MAIFSMIGVGIASLFGAAAWVGQLIGAGLAFGTQYLLNSYLNRSKKRDYAAVQGQREYGARVPVWALYGTGLVKGHHVFYAKWGAGNKFNADVLVLSNGWCDGLEPEIYFYGEKHTLVARPIIANEVAHYGVAGFDDLISIRFYDGRPGQGVDTKLVADTANLGQTWKAASRCAGMTYVVVERQWSEEKFEKGEPQFDFVLRGLRVYDPRKDSTVAGGSGTQRLDDPSTWQFSRNPAVQRLNYQLGLRGYRSGRTLIGEGKTIGQLDLASYFAAMNVADTLRLGKPTYQSSLLVTSDDDHTEVLKEFDDALAGYGMNRRGLSGVIPGAPQIPVLDIGPDDIDMGRAKTTRLRKSAFSLYNQMSGQFTSPEANWTPQSLMPLYVNADIAADGRARQVANDFLQVTDPDIAQYLLQIRYRQNRKGGSATVPVSRRVGFNVMEGDWVTYLGKTWLVTGWQMNASLEITLTLAETGSDVYSSAGIEPGPIVIPSPPPVNPSLLSTVQGFRIEVGLLGGDTGDIPTLRFLWEPPNDPTIVAVRFEYFEGVDPLGQKVHKWRSDAPESGVEETSASVMPGRLYTARATIVTVPDRLKDWTPWSATPDATGQWTLYPAGMVDEILEQVGETTEFADYGAREALERAREIVATDGASAGYDHLESRRQANEISVRVGETRAYVREEIFVAVGPESAIALQLTEQRAEYLGGIAANTSLISTEVSTINSQITAVGSRIDLLETEVDGIESRFTMRAEVVASPGAGRSRWVVQVQSGSPGNYVSSTLFLEAEAGGLGSAGFLADRFYIYSGNARYRPVVVQGGVLYADELRVRRANIVEFTATWAEIRDAVVYNFVATSANIGYAVIGDGEIAAGAVTNSNYGSNSINLPPTGSWQTVLTVPIASPGGNPVMVYYNIRVTNSGTGALGTGWRLLRNGAVIKEGSGAALAAMDELIMDNAGAGSHTYQLVAQRNEGALASATGSLILQCNKK